MEQRLQLHYTWKLFLRLHLTLDTTLVTEETSSVFQATYYPLFKEATVHFLVEVNDKHFNFFTYYQEHYYTTVHNYHNHLLYQ